MFKNMKNIVAMIALSILIISSPAWSLDSLIVNITRASVIVNPDDTNDMRALLQFDLPELLDTTKYVMVAELRFRINIPQQFDRLIKLRACPLTREWSPDNVGWNIPWDNAGGDFADTMRALGHVSQSGETEIKIDVAHLIQNYIRGYLPNHGLIVRQIGEPMRRFTLVPYNSPEPDDTIVQLAIYYVDMEPDN